MHRRLGIQARIEPNSVDSPHNELRFSSYLIRECNETWDIDMRNGDLSVVAFANHGCTAVKTRVFTAFFGVLGAPGGVNQVLVSKDHNVLCPTISHEFLQSPVASLAHGVRYFEQF